MKLLTTFFAFFLCVLALATAAASSSSSRFFVQSQQQNADDDTVNSTKLFHLSDLHLDLWFGQSCGVHVCRNSSVPKTGLPGCDSSPEMVRGVLRQIARTIVDSGAQTSIIVYTGDHFRHDFGASCMGDINEAAFKTVDFILKAFKDDLYAYVSEYEQEVILRKKNTPPLLQRLRSGNTNTNKKQRSIHMLPIGHHQPFADAIYKKNKRINGRLSQSTQRVLNTSDNLGNEDFVPDYFFNFTDTSTNPILQKFSSKLLAQGFLQTPDQATLFSRCAFSYRTLDDLQIRVIILNTLLYATELKPATSDKDPCGQFAFMKEQLDAARANNQRVIIQSHIPPYFGLWKPDILGGQYYSTYNGLVSDNADIIAIQLYGHIHRFQYGQMTSLSSSSVGYANMPPMFLGGPVTRASKTTPDFGVYDLDPVTFAVTDIHQVVIADDAQDPLLAASWQMGPSFKQSLGLADMSGTSLYNLAHSMRFDSSFDAIFQNYLVFEQGGRVPAGVTCTGSCQWIAACELIAFTTVEDAECALLMKK